MNLLLESIIPIDTVHFAVRVWKQEEFGHSMDRVQNDNIVKAIREIVFPETGIPMHVLTLANSIISLPYPINAVEVKPRYSDGDIGIGVVLYKDWP